MDKIPFYQPSIGHLEREYVNIALDEGWISSKGRFIEEFENEFADFIGAKYAIATNTGTAACHVALLATSFDLSLPMKVIVPNLTFVATANAVKYCGGEVILSDVQKDTWVLGDNIITEPNITHVFLVHLLGNMCDIKPLRFKYPNAVFVEDACEAHGSSFNEVKAGAVGDIACFSFFGNKTITTGEGGMITTNNQEYYERALHLRGQAQTTQYFHDMVGHNYRMTNIQAAIGLAQMQKIESILIDKKRIRERYDEFLDGTDLRVQSITPGCVSNNWVYTICGIKKPLELQAYLARRKIGTRIMFRPLSTMPMYNSEEADYWASRIADSCLMLPSYPNLTNVHINDICKCIKGYLKT